jgi:hypothetical protein
LPTPADKSSDPSQLTIVKTFDDLRSDE